MTKKLRRPRIAAKHAQVAPVETATDARLLAAAEIEASGRRGKARDRLYDAQALVKAVIDATHVHEGKVLDDASATEMRRTLRVAVEVIDTAQEAIEAELSLLSSVQAVRAARSLI
jgi:hypothetical protein